MTVQAIRLFVAVSAVASLSLLTPASARAPAAPRACAAWATADTSMSAAASPSKLDYVVLASLADAPSLMGLSAYRAPASSLAAD